MQFSRTLAIRHSLRYIHHFHEVNLKKSSWQYENSVEFLTKRFQRDVKKKRAPISQLLTENMLLLSGEDQGRFLNWIMGLSTVPERGVEIKKWMDERIYRELKNDATAHVGYVKLLQICKAPTSEVIQCLDNLSRMTQPCCIQFVNCVKLGYLDNEELLDYIMDRFPLPSIPSSITRAYLRIGAEQKATKALNHFIENKVSYQSNALFHYFSHYNKQSKIIELFHTYKNTDLITATFILLLAHSFATLGDKEGLKEFDQYCHQRGFQDTEYYKGVFMRAYWMIDDVERVKNIYKNVDILQIQTSEMVICMLAMARKIDKPNLRHVLYQAQQAMQTNHIRRHHKYDEEVFMLTIDLEDPFLIETALHNLQHRQIWTKRLFEGCFSAMGKGLIRSESIYHYYEIMRNHRIKPDNKTFVALLEAFHFKKDIKGALWAYHELTHQYQLTPNNFVYEKMLQIVTSLACQESLHFILNEMTRSRSFVWNHHLYSTMQTCLQNDPLLLDSWMKQNNLSPIADNK